MTTKECEQKGGANRLRLLYSSRLSSDLLKKYLGELVKSGLLIEDNTTSREVIWKGKTVNRGNIYHITSKGIQYLLIVDEMRQMGIGVLDTPT